MNVFIRLALNVLSLVPGIKLKKGPKVEPLPPRKPMNDTEKS